MTAAREDRLAEASRGDESTEPAETGVGLQMLLALLRSGADVATVLPMLAHIPMKAEQRAIVDLLGALQHGSGGVSGGEAHERTSSPLADPPPDAADSFTLKELREELANLREVNDTLAAALGACRACWGGHVLCAHCDGDGCAGSSPPVPKLFNALVLPAVRRMRARRSSTTEAFV